MKKCPFCKEEIQDDAIKCKHCHSNLAPTVTQEVGAAKRKPTKVTAGILAILLGVFGIHKFYLGAWGWGLVYICFSVFLFSSITVLVGIVEGVRYLILSDEEFDQKLAELEGPFAILW